MQKFKSFSCHLLILLGLNSMLVPVYAQSRIDSLKKVRSTNNQKTHLNTLIELCWEYRYTHPDTARIYGFQALKLASKQKITTAEVEALHNLAVTFEAQGDYKEALAYNLRALQIRRKIGDQLKTANTLNNIGICYDELGNFSLALKHYNQAYQIYKLANNMEKLAMVSTNLGVLFKAHEDYPQVISYYKEAEAIYTQLKLPLETAMIAANLGSVYYYTKQYDSCISYSKKAQQIFIKQNILQYLPLTYANIGIAQLALGDVPSALQHLEKALALHTKYGNKKEMAFCYIHLGNAMFKLKKYGPAKKHALSALGLAKKIGASKQVMDAQQLLSNLYKQEKDFRNALLSYRSYAEIKDSLFKKEKTRLITDFQVRYETEKKEEQIKLLNQKSMIQKLQIKQRNTYLFLVVGLFLIGMAMSYLIYNRRKLKARAQLQEEINKQQDMAAVAILNAEEQERRRIAGDLHDGVGQLLSAALMNMNTLFNKLDLKDEQGLQAQKTLALVTESYDEMRTISHQMMPNALIKAGLASAVKEFLNKLAKDQLRASLEIIGLDKRLNEQVETVLYRIIQETVNNVIKHADANELKIQIMKDDEGVTVTVEDNGKGFEKNNLHHSGGIGINNIFSRVAFLKGSIDIDTTPGKGTLILIHIPA